jgi:uncharacterized protein (TIGR00369 family)
MDLIKDNGCFVCGPANARGFRAMFSLDRDARTACGRLTLPEWAQGWQGMVHGGILSTLLDEVCAHACRTVGPHPVTAELTVRFRKPVPVGAEVVVRGEVVEIRRRVLQAKAELQVDGEVYAEAQARVVLIDPPA